MASECHFGTCHFVPAAGRTIRPGGTGPPETIRNTGIRWSWDERPGSVAGRGYALWCDSSSPGALCPRGGSVFGSVHEGRAAGQLVDLAAYEGIGEGGVTADERLGEEVDGLPDEAVELLGAELLDHVGDGGFLGGPFVDLAGLLPAGGDLPEPGLQLAAAGLQPVGHLGQEIVAVLDPGPDIAGAVLELA